MIHSLNKGYIMRYCPYCDINIWLLGIWLLYNTKAFETLNVFYNKNVSKVEMIQTFVKNKTASIEIVSFQIWKIYWELNQLS